MTALHSRPGFRAARLLRFRLLLVSLLMTACVARRVAEPQQLKDVSAAMQAKPTYIQR